MSLATLQNTFANSSFLTLLLTTFLYWIQLGFSTKTLNPVFGNIGFLLSNLQLLGLLVLRWYESHHFPLSNLYESLIFLAWSLTMGYFVIPSKKGSNLMVGAIIAPSALFINAFASLILPETLKVGTALVPALQSNWLMMHVTMMIISYSMLILGSLFSIGLLIISVTSPTLMTADGQKTKKNQINETPISQILDNLSYRTLGFGFPLLTIGILSGAVWANQAWGSYWSWDPKETWAFITWLIFAIYFHLRLNKNWSGEKPAIVASIGFVLLWVCYLGVNLLGKGLHSYGWFS
uniref:cytochrome c heme attachment protein n=1 Tax=Tetraselmis marina TaxID=41888 RepID=UPI0021AC2EBD|nr:cytochrome c heme attachment protein [Tetraselmis marina]YP_010455906.1 cytochrome c heme attachment protein [Tetraselmis marina]UUA64579.1 cytochrome c heme attachment protein [Tetraselmis marina]UUA64582.1 cytochrome c heme attachment protein [Tetraselmis marina]